VVPHSTAIIFTLTLWFTSARPVTALVVALVALPFLLGVRRLRKLALMMIITVLWGCFTLYQHLNDRITWQEDGSELLVIGTVVSLPSRSEHGQRFAYRIEHSAPGLSVELPITVLLRDYTGLSMSPGERWQLQIRLSTPTGVVNSHLFDYQGWLFQQQFAATGTIRTDSANQRITPPGHNVDYLRLKLRNWIDAQLPPASSGGLAAALMLGDSSSLSSDQWTWLTITGTQHLMVISGLHLSLVIAGSFLLARSVLGGGLAVVFATLSGGFYSLLAGFGLPVQRALIMGTVGLIALQVGRQVTAYRVYWLAMICVLIREPTAFYKVGFWLSFGVVAALILFFSGRQRWQFRVSQREAKYFVDVLQSQLVAFFGLLPWLAVTVRQVSLVAPLYNMIAIPWIGSIIVPLMLIAALLSLLAELLCLGNPDVGFFVQRTADFLLHYAAQHLVGLWQFISGYESSWALRWLPVIDELLVPGILIASLLLLLPLPWQMRWISLVLILPLLSPGEKKVETPSLVSLTVFDVGQGSALLINTAQQNLLYDAGPRFGEFDTGARILVPQFRMNRVDQIHRIVISHGDVDHAGGLESVQSAYPLAPVFGSGDLGRSCSQPLSWQDDHVGFLLFNLAKMLPEQTNDNDVSCILLVFAGDRTLVIPGDISAFAEKLLLSLIPDKVDLLLVPHHGSITSSSPALLNRVENGLAVVSSGNPRRFGHPHIKVLKRYQLRKIAVLNTFKEGAVTIVLGSDGQFQLSCSRHQGSQLWYDPYHAHPLCHY